MKGVSKDVVRYLNDFQFGVGVSGSVEAILHSANIRQAIHRWFFGYCRGEGEMHIYFFVDWVSLWTSSKIVPWGDILCQSLECNKVTR